MTRYDVIVVGGGPAGSACAGRCGEAGLKTVLLERSIFPREKVCGDCLNPACWPVLDRLGVSERVRALPHAKLHEIEFIRIDGGSVRFPLPDSELGERAIKRSRFDLLLLERAAELGVEIRQDAPVRSIEEGWKVHTGGEEYTGEILVAADGRNSTVARLLGHLPSPARDRVGLQAHVADPGGWEGKLALKFLKEGYCGITSVGCGEINLCLVGKPESIPKLKSWGERNAAVPTDYPWRVITPLARPPIPAAIGKALFVGDAARVVEPFTGEGIAYALISGELAATHIVRGSKNRYADGFAAYIEDHRAIYKGRLWINKLSKQAVLNPRIGNMALGFFLHAPMALRFLTNRVVGRANALA